MGQMLEVQQASSPVIDDPGLVTAGKIATAVQGIVERANQCEWWRLGPARVAIIDEKAILTWL